MASVIWLAHSTDETRAQLIPLLRRAARWSHLPLEARAFLRWLVEEFDDVHLRELFQTRHGAERAALARLLGDQGSCDLTSSPRSDHCRIATGDQRSAHNRLAVLSSLLKCAHENKLIAQPTIRLFLKRGGRKEAPILAVPSSDVQRLIEAAKDERYRVAVRLAAEAGLRIGEILGLQWGDVRATELHIRRAVDSAGNVGLPKHNKTREVHLSPELVCELGRMRHRGLWVVSTLDGGMLSYWAAVDAIRALYARAGVDIPESETGTTMPWHSLRHTFGTELAAKNVPLTTLQELMGHEDIATTRRYVTVTRQHRHDAIALAFGQQVGNRAAASA